MSTLLHLIDAETRGGKIVKLASRPDAEPRHPNPVRRFREELRLTRDEFALLMAVPKDTLRAWERDVNAVVPSGSRTTRLIELARRNYYPLMLKELYDYCEKNRAVT